MTTNLEMPAGSDEEWLMCLRPYQREIAETLLTSNSPEHAAQLWISSNGPTSIVQFGGEGQSKPFWDCFVNEFRDFICGHHKYEKDRKSLSEQGGITRELMISAVSSGIGAAIGYPATFLAPAATLLLISVGRVGLNAYCRTENSPEQSDAPKSPIGRDL